MLTGISIYTANELWRKILVDLGATVLTDSKFADLDFDSLNVSDKITPLELKSLILNTIEKEQNQILNQIFNKNVILPRLQMNLVVLLFRTCGMSVNDLKNVLGYSPDVATHTIDTAIYQLRKIFGRDFIKNENGKYFIGN